MGKRLPANASSLPFCSSSADNNKMPPIKRPGTDSDATTENFSWTDDAVQQLLLECSVHIK